MKTYVLSVAGIVILSALISLFAPNGKLNHTIKGITRLACITVLVVPFTNLEQTFHLPDEIQPQESYIHSCIQLAEEYETQFVVQRVYTKFKARCEAKIECKAQAPFSVKNVQVNVMHVGISDNSSHINILDEIYSWLKTTYSCPLEVFCRDCNHAIVTK